MFRAVRIFILLFILATVSYSAYRAKAQSVEWKYTLMVNIYPINGDGSALSDAYIKSLTLDEFQSIEQFMLSAAEHYGKKQNASIQIRLQNTLTSKPPAPPESSNVLEVMWWSLQFRWWAYWHAKVQGPGTQVRLFVQYFDPQKTQVHRSTALQEGLIGQVNVFASNDMREKNNVIIAHEFLHTLGATDKYDLRTDFPNFPDGYAEPEKQPLHPQNLAEIMGGRVPVSEYDAVIPRHLNRVVIGAKTAQEINFLPKSN
ncbi:hypothetical protein H8K52_17245 [Undibacterium seohonense]|uniref:Uncharacterized protein n=1 Tax=Undibacterium seohonense TaxID=1344950 RepID=A0ABR6X812_9BURK|nr:hypothetical protein [Undibacterium seohonense]MBC3809088.1 hypothetical protein [Undibacterium seohonense]